MKQYESVMHAACWLMLMEELKDIKLVSIAEPNTARAQKYVDNYGVKLYTDGNVITADLPRLSPRPIWMRGHDDINVSDMRPYVDELLDFVRVIRSGSEKGAVTLAEAAAAFRLAKKELELALEG